MIEGWTLCCIAFYVVFTTYYRIGNRSKQMGPDGPPKKLLHSKFLCVYISCGPPAPCENVKWEMVLCNSGIPNTAVNYFPVPEEACALETECANKNHCKAYYYRDNGGYKCNFTRCKEPLQCK